jgi:hypothetical protein
MPPAGIAQGPLAPIDHQSLAPARLTIGATAHYWNIRTLPCLSTMCQDDDAHSVLSTSYSKNYEPSQAVVYEGCVGMDVALLSIDLFINVKRLKTLSA